MKKIYHLFLLAATICLFAACSDNYTIDYLPAKADESDDWGFINSKGELFLDGEFENEPSNVVEGLFSVKEGDNFTLYRFDQKKPKEILSDLMYVGEANGGMLPVTKKDSKIEIIDLDGKTLFTLDRIDGKVVVECAYRYDFDYLKVAVLDGTETQMALIDRKGNVVIKPKYNRLYTLAKDLFLAALIEEKDGDKTTTFTFLNSKGEKLKNWKLDEDGDINVFGDYVVIKRDDRWRIYDLKGDEILKCKEKVKDIYNIKDGFIVVADDDDKLGVIDMKGENVVSMKYESLIITDDGFLARKEDDEFIFLNRKGEKENSTDWVGIFDIDGFAILAREKSDDDNFHYQYIVNAKGEQIVKNDMFDIDCNITCGYIASDFFDCGEIADAITSGIKSDLTNHGVQFGGLISSCDLGDPYVSYSFCKYPYLQGVKYSISLRLYSNDDLRVPIYSTRTVQRYNMYDGYYYTTEYYVDHYDLNSDATLSVAVFNIACPEQKQLKLNQSLCKNFASKGETIQDGYYRFDGKYVLVQKSDYSGIDIFVSPESLESYMSDALVVEVPAEDAAAEEAVVEDADY